MVGVVRYEAQREEWTLGYVPKELQLGAPIAADLARDATRVQVRRWNPQIVAGVLRLEDQVRRFTGKGRHETIAEVHAGLASSNVVATCAVPWIARLEERNSSEGAGWFAVGGGKVG